MADKFPLAWHGDGFLVKTEEASYDLDVKVISVDKTETNISVDISLAFINLYYYLYIGDAPKVFESIRILSEATKNTISENRQVKPTVRKHYGSIKPWQL